MTWTEFLPQHGQNSTSARTKFYHITDMERSQPYSRQNSTSSRTELYLITHIILPHHGQQGQNSTSSRTTFNLITYRTMYTSSGTEFYLIRNRILPHHEQNPPQHRQNPNTSRTECYYKNVQHSSSHGQNFTSSLKEFFLITYRILLNLGPNLT